MNRSTCHSTKQLSGNESTVMLKIEEFARLGLFHNTNKWNNSEYSFGGVIILVPEDAEFTEQSQEITA